MFCYANYLVLAKTDLEDHFQNKLLENTENFTTRSGTDLKQIDGTQRQLISYKVRKGNISGYWSYRYFSIFIRRQLKARATIFF